MNKSKCSFNIRLNHLNNPTSEHWLDLPLVNTKWQLKEKEGNLETLTHLQKKNNSTSVRPCTSITKNLIVNILLESITTELSKNFGS